MITYIKHQFPVPPSLYRNWQLPACNRTDNHPPLRSFRQLDDKQLEDVAQKIKEENRVKKKKKEYILCGSCKHIITSVDQRFKVAGQFSHTFRNPAGIVYNIGCFSSAPGAFNIGDPTLEFTWFPGYAWVFTNCLNCLVHLGWFYQSGDHHFYGLILNHLTHMK